MIEIATKNSKESEIVGKILAQELWFFSKQKRHSALVIALKGNLGSGKTTFVKGIAQGLGIKQRITSPTFIILKRYKIQIKRIKNKSPIAYFYHIDCYRLKKPKEILDLGFKEIISQAENIVVIEWAERIKKILPKERITVKFKFVNEKTRKLVIS